MANLTIDIYCNDGSPLKITPPMIYGRGVGGAELSMMTWAETMAGRGHRVRVYNDPDTAGAYDDVDYLPQGDFQPGQYRDVLIVYRSPTPGLKDIKAGVKIHWSTDQFTMGDYKTDIVPYVDKVICISPYHMRDYAERYAPPEDKLTYIDLGVRLQDYPLDIEKIQNRFIFCSVPDRGLEEVRYIWPNIKEAIPDATLTIFSDYTLWGSLSPRDHNHRLNMLGVDGIVYMGAKPRHFFAKKQAEAQIHLYPCTYNELFCISAAECQAVGAYPITSGMGALETTNEFGLIVPGEPKDPNWQRSYIDIVIATVLDQDRLTKQALKGANLARDRFDWERICDQWESVIEGAGI
jgi:glycosyltransferase involved in cell wall biosynthesis